MFSAKLYTVRKILALEIFKANYNIKINNSDYFVAEQDSMLFRQIRLITGNYSKYIPYIIFIDCHGAREKKENIRKLVLEGFYVNGIHYSMSERSASMTRNAILGFVQTDIIDKLNQAITMDLNIGKTVLSKWCAYRGLMFSSCHCLDGYYPKMIVVKDFKRMLYNQKIRYLIDKETPYIDKETKEDKIWRSKGIDEGLKDIEINVFDGCGIHHPQITDEIQNIIGMEERPTSIQLRAPFIKGLSHEIDYTAYFKEHGIDYIQDIWGKWHSVEEPMIILTEGMYKGLKYFKNTGTYADWDNYWSKFKKYNHCIGVAKWNFTPEQEPVYTRGNYQILQDLDLSFDDFKQLLNKSLDWATKVTGGDSVYSYCFMGITGESPKLINDYSKAVVKNTQMLKEESIHNFLKKQTKLYIDKMKCGKIYLKSCYKFLMPDMIMLLQWIGGDKDPQGVLSENEFWSAGYKNDKEYLIERNPHICKSEHLILKCKDNDEIEKYCGHLVNTCMLNGKSVSPQRLNGADFDGDLILLIDEPIMISGVDRNCGIVLNLDEKMTAIAESVTPEAISSLVERTMVSLIGEASNAATCYHNKKASPESRKKYNTYIDILSIVNSFAIDFAKTGYIMNIPYVIAKYSKPYPYFMRYVSDYYEKLYQGMEKGNSNYKFQKNGQSNMNRACFTIEKFHNNEIKWKKNIGFDYSIMIDEEIPEDKEKYEQIAVIYKDYRKQIRYLSQFEDKLHNYDLYKDELKAWNKENAMSYKVNWDSVYDKFRKECEAICPNKKELANIAVKLCYNTCKSGNKKFMWVVASEGILSNLKQQEVYLPIKDSYGEYEYLGKKYSLVKYVPELSG